MEYVFIQDAVNAANSGDTIRISAGNYSEQIVIANKGRLTLVGEPGVVIHATPGMTQTLLPFQWGFFPVLGAFRSDVVLRDLTFDGHNLGNLYSGLFGVYCLGSGGRVENCTIRGFRPLGTTGYGTAGLRIQNAVGIGSPPVDIGVFNSTFEDNEIALHLRGEPDLNPTLLRTTFTIEGNAITGVGPSGAAFRGIAIRTGASGVIKSNIIRNHSYTGTGETFASGVAAYDDNATNTNRVPLRFIPLFPVRYESNTFSNNDEHLVIIGGNASEVVNNIFHGTGPAGPRWGALALSGTNILVADNDIADTPTGVFLFGNEILFSGWPLISPARNPALHTNWFCNVALPSRTHPLVTGLVERGSARCENDLRRPVFRSIGPVSAQGVRTLLRSWHGRPVVVEASTDFQHWAPVHTNAMALPTVTCEVADTYAAPHRFVRAVVP